MGMNGAFWVEDVGRFSTSWSYGKDRRAGWIQFYLIQEPTGWELWKDAAMDAAVGKAGCDLVMRFTHEDGTLEELKHVVEAMYALAGGA
jgi:hypothetical protein